MNSFEEKMTQYEADCTPTQPPCHEEITVPMFSIYIEGKRLSNGEVLMPADRIRASYPELNENDLKQLIEYLDTAEWYCIEVCGCFSRQYDTPFIPESEQAQRDALRVEKVCRARYLWMSKEQIHQILSSVCWQSNR